MLHVEGQRTVAFHIERKGNVFAAEGFTDYVKKPKTIKGTRLKIFWIVFPFRFLLDPFLVALRFTLHETLTFCYKINKVERSWRFCFDVFPPCLVQNGESAIELAYWYRHDDIVTLLMSHGDKVSFYVMWNFRVRVGFWLKLLQLWLTFSRVWQTPRDTYVALFSTVSTLNLVWPTDL